MVWVCHSYDNKREKGRKLMVANSPTFDHDHHSIILNSTVVTPLEKTRNSRWYCNRLSKLNDLTNDNFESIIPLKSSNNLKYVVSCDDNKNAAVDSLRKKLIMKLIDISSPTSKINRSSSKSWLNIQITRELFSRWQSKWDHRSKNNVDEQLYLNN